MQYAFYRLIRASLHVILWVWNRISIHGKENVPPKGQGFIVAANHVSYLDPPAVGVSINRPMMFLAKDRLFKIPVFRHIVRWLQVKPVEGDEEMRTIRQAVKTLKGGIPVAVFPEGTRSGGDEFLQPQPGAAFLARVAGVPILPCYVQGTGHALSPGQSRYRPVKIRVFFGPTVSTEGRAAENKSDRDRRVAYEVMNRILELKRNVESETVNHDNHRNKPKPHTTVQS